MKHEGKIGLGLFVAIIFLSAIVASFIRYGVGSFLFLFLSSCFFYLSAFPFLLTGFDQVAGIQVLGTQKYYAGVFVYCIFYILGVRITAPQAFTKYSNLDHSPNYIAMKKKGFKVASIALLVLSVLMVTYSVISQNIFSGGNYLFTIVGFDLLLVYYLIGRQKRSTTINSMLFVGILVLFVYAGFRYRMAILLGAVLDNQH